jgi:hypothetical protein
MKTVVETLISSVSILVTVTTKPVLSPSSTLSLKVTNKTTTSRHLKKTSSRSKVKNKITAAVVEPCILVAATTKHKHKPKSSSSSQSTKKSCSSKKKTITKKKKTMTRVHTLTISNNDNDDDDDDAGLISSYPSPPTKTNLVRPDLTAAKIGTPLTPRGPIVASSAASAPVSATATATATATTATAQVTPFSSPL